MKYIILRFLWPEKIIRSYNLLAIYNYISNRSKSDGLLCRANIYFILKITYSFFSNVILLPVSIVLFVMNYRFIYGTRFQQVGETILLDVTIRKNKLNKNKHKLIFLYYPPFHDNAYLLSLYKDHLIFIEKTWMLFILSPLAHSFLTRIYVVDCDTLSSNCKTASIFQKFQHQYNKPLIKMQSKDINECKDLISRYIQDHKFVCIHAREAGFKNGYYADLERITRNADINTYDLLIDKLIELDYVVVRLGDPCMQEVPYLKEKYKENFIDYAHSSFRSEKMDVYLLSNCDFLVACSSGPSDVSNIFNINTLLLNGYPAVDSLRFKEGDLSIFKKVTNIKTGNVVDIRKLFSKPFDQPLQINGLSSMGYELIDNSRDEVCTALEDFLSIRGQPDKIDVYSVAYKELFKDYHHGYKSSGRFSKSFVEGYVNNSK